jgi:ubiquinone/menaquinone biosynthesis C-methylase UbiE
MVVSQEIKLDVESYSQFYETALGKAVVRAESEIIRDYLENCSRILDVGCGEGVLERALPDLTITGVDASSEMILKAKERGGAFLQGKGEDLPFPGHSFDGVFFITSLEFVEDYKKALNEALRVVTKKGRLLILLLNRDSQYFTDHYAKAHSVFRKAQAISPQEIKRHLEVRGASVDMQFAVGIRKETVFDTADPKLASIVVVRAQKTQQ